MINVKDRLPEGGQVVVVKIGKDFGIASYDENFGFCADDSAYDIYCDDNSGLMVDLIGKVSHWMDIPTD